MPAPDTAPASGERLDHLGGIFSQVTPALDRSQGGLGIGLALVRGFVELHASCRPGPNP